MEFVTLDKEGFPMHRLYSDGHVVNTETNNELKPQKVVQLNYKGKVRGFNTSILLRKYFGSELQTIPEKERFNLACIGYKDYTVTMDGRLWSHIVERWLTPSKNKEGYNVVYLVNVGEPKQFRLDALVAGAFLPNICLGDCVLHLDGNKANDAAWNLKWLTRDEWMRQAQLNGDAAMALTVDEIHKACQMIVAGKSNVEIAHALGTYAPIIQHIRKGHTYRDISQNYGIVPTKALKRRK